MTTGEVIEQQQRGEERWGTVADAARRLGKSECQIRTMLARGDLAAVKVMGRIAVRWSSVEQYALPASPFRQ